MKLINRILLFVVISFFAAANVEAQETMYVYKDGAIVGEHVLAEVDSVIFYKVENTVTDIDGNVYNTVEIGTQTWMAENLKTISYNDGTAIQNITNGSTWGSLTSGAYCWYNNDEVSYKEPYGALYNWYAVNTDKLCPIGWHVPTNSEWETLITFLGGSTVAGGKMKENSSEYWTSPNEGATNESGFSALPGGDRFYDGSFNNHQLGTYGAFWTATETYFRYLFNHDSKIYTTEYDKKIGYSVRCVED